MTEGHHPTDPDPLAGLGPTDAAAADAQLAHEAALGRALLMVQRMEEEARERIARQSEAAMTRAQYDAAALVEDARRRAAEVAEITRSSVARVLAEEHAELLAGLAELSALEQRLRTTVISSRERIAAVLGDPAPAAGPSVPSVPDEAPVAPTAPRVGSEPPTAPPPVAPPSAVAPPVPVATPDLDLDAPVPGADDEFFADLRDAVDGRSTIAGRSAPVDRGSTEPAAPAAFAAAAAAATAAATAPAPSPVPEQVATPAEPLTAPAPPTLRVVPPPVTPAAPPPVTPAAEPVASPPVDAAPTTEMPDVDEAAGARPEGRQARHAHRRSRWARIGTGVRNLGILLLLFVAFQLWGTSALEHRDQARLKQQFTVALASQNAPGTVIPPVPGDGGDPSTVTTATTAPAAPTGEAVAVIRIPKIGVEQAVVEGTGVSDLRKGPGHYRNTPMPGQPGNAAIAGHRTTYGAPFNRLDELSKGDPILVTTLQGKYRYVVDEAPFAVNPSQNDVLFPKGDNRLTLTTCHPKYSASKRLIVVAKLAKDEKPARAPKPATRATLVRADASASGDAGAALPALLWGGLALAAYAGMVWLSRHWVRRAALLLGAPIVLALLFPFFEQLSRLLPANY